MLAQTYRLLKFCASALIAMLLALSGLVPAYGGEAAAAVAANFTQPAEELGAAFAAQTGDTITFSFGATGGLYTQISQGAPFDLFLAADDERPARAIAEGLAVAGTDFTYAIGKLALYAPGIDLSEGAGVLKSSDFSHIAIADPATAPYGAAAVETIAKYGLTETLRAREVIGANISQALQFVESGNAELGFVALSQVADKPAPHVWIVPQQDYAPIRQDAILLTRGKDNPAALAFLDFLKTEAAQAIIARYGYDVE